jgi:hypothetical protein
MDSGVTVDLRERELFAQIIALTFIAEYSNEMGAQGCSR